MPGWTLGKDCCSKAQREFLAEAEEIVERLRDDEGALADQRAAGGEIDPEQVNRLFRSAHSLKSLAGMFGFEAIASLAHRLEDLLDGLRLGRISMHSPPAARLGEAVDLLGTLIGELLDGREPPGASERVAALAERLDEPGEAAPAGAEPPEASRGAAEPASAVPSSEWSRLDLEGSLLRALTEYEEHRLRESIGRGRRVLLIESTFEVLSFDEGLAELTRQARAIGELLSTLPSPGVAADSQICFGLLVATDLPAAAVSERVSIPHAVRTVYEPGIGRAAARPAPGAAPIQHGTATDAARPVPGPPAADTAPERGEEAEIESLRSISGTVRVDIRKLDELMNLVGGLSIQRAALAGITRRLLADQATQRIGSDLDKVQSRLERRLKELQAGVLDVRMVPLRQVFEKLSRVVRRLRRELSREVRLEVRGADTELDKLIVEDLVAPLVHVVRNAFDHGIEPRDERLAAGKPAEGVIRVEASQRGRHVVIQVCDDGRGIDPAALRARAEEAGFVAPEQPLTRKEMLELVFLPGFSTSAEVSGTSGRGVGMDVVRSNLANLAGAVDVDSIPGRGTTITMTLPITLAIVQALIVAVGEQRYAIPLDAVLETLVLEPERVQRSEGREILDLRGDPLPLRRLRDEFALEGEPRGRPHVVVMGLGEGRLGLLVDRLEGEQDAVVKPIQGPVRNVRGIAGATELEAQGAVLVLDPSALVGDTVRSREAA